MRPIKVCKLLKYSPPLYLNYWQNSLMVCWRKWNVSMTKLGLFVMKHAYVWYMDLFWSAAMTKPQAHRNHLKLYFSLNSISFRGFSMSWKFDQLLSPTDSESAFFKALKFMIFHFFLVRETGAPPFQNLNKNVRKYGLECFWHLQHSFKILPLLATFTLSLCLSLSVCVS